MKIFGRYIILGIFFAIFLTGSAAYSQSEKSVPVNPAAEWSLETIQQGTYLKGEQNTPFGLGKDAFICDADQRRIVFIPYYTLGVRNYKGDLYAAANSPESVVAGTSKHKIIIDKDFIEIQPSTPLAVVNKETGTISAGYLLPPALLPRIENAKIIGMAWVPPNDFMYWGFRIDVSESDSKKINDYINDCFSSSRNIAVSQQQQATLEKPYD